MNFLHAPASNQTGDWITFIILFITVTLPIPGFALWLMFFRKKGHKHGHKHRKRRKHRRINPTRAQTGGLPPKRDPNQPPPGP